MHPDPDSYPQGPLFLYPRLVFDPAFLGWGRRPADPTPIAIYDFARCVDAVMHWYDFSPEDAHDYVVTQCEGAWLGPGTPLIAQLGSPEALEELL
ncbi:MAG: hypothetical protein ACO3LH_05660 [Steroidobacteraceae bacterium]